MWILPGVGKKFAFIERSRKPLCLICNTVLNHFKVSNLKWHYPDSEICSHKIKSLKSSAQCQMKTLTAFYKEADITTEASYVIVWNIVRSKHSHTNGEFIKENILQVASILDSSNKKLLSYFPNYCTSNWRPQCQCYNVIEK